MRRFILILILHSDNVLAAILRETTEVLDASVDFYSLQGDDFVELEADNEEKSLSACSPDVVSDLLAVRACGEAKWHRPTGSQEEEVALDKVMFAGESSSLQHTKTNTIGGLLICFFVQRRSSPPAIEPRQDGRV